MCSAHHVSRIFLKHLISNSWIRCNFCYLVSVMSAEFYSRIHKREWIWNNFTCFAPGNGAFDGSCRVGGVDMKSAVSKCVLQVLVTPEKYWGFPNEDLLSIMVIVEDIVMAQNDVWSSKVLGVEGEDQVGSVGDRVRLFELGGGGNSVRVEDHTFPRASQRIASW